MIMRMIRYDRVRLKVGEPQEKEIRAGDTVRKTNTTRKRNKSGRHRKKNKYA